MFSRISSRCNFKNGNLQHQKWKKRRVGKVQILNSGVVEAFLASKSFPFLERILYLARDYWIFNCFEEVS